MPEITEEQLEWFQKQAQTAQFVESIYNNPRTSTKAKALIKEAYPDLEIPGYDAQQYVDQRFAERDQRAAEYARQQREANEDRMWREQREATQKKYGFTEEAMADLEKTMKDRSVADYEVAATYHVAKNPKTSQPTFDDNRWNYQKSDNWGEISKDPEGWARNEILGAIRNDEARQRNQF
jgi:hypothetical protein